MHGGTKYHVWSFSDSDAAFRRDRLRIILRPCATRHKFRLFKGFATGRPTEHPPGRPLRNRIQAMGMSAGRKKKYTASGLVRGGCPLTSQTAFGGQLPYKGSLVQPVVRFDHNPCRYDGRFLRATKNEPRATVFLRAEGHSSDVVILRLLPCSGI